MTNLEKFEENKLKDFIEIIWDIDDVLEVRPDLTKEQARLVLHEVGRRHDANYGISWEFIQCIAYILYPEANDNGEQA